MKVNRGIGGEQGKLYQKFSEENRGIFVESSGGGPASCLAIHGSMDGGQPDF